MEINPNHPVTIEMHDLWHKMVAVLMVKFGVSQVTITSEDVQRFAELWPHGAVVFHAHKDTMDLRLVDAHEATEMAKKEGGMPV